MVEAGEMQSMIPTKVTLEDRLKSLINKSPLMIFMKGDRKVNIYLGNYKAQFTNDKFYHGFSDSEVWLQQAAHGDNGRPEPGV